MKLVVGQKVFLKRIFRHSESTIRETTVTKVGNKYFEIEGSWSKFHLSTGYEKTEITPNEKVYESMEEIENEKEHNNLQMYILSKANNYELRKLSLQQLRDIKSIIESI